MQGASRVTAPPAALRGRIRITDDEKEAAIAPSSLCDLRQALQEARSLEGIVLLCHVLIYPYQPPRSLQQRLHNLKVEDSSTYRLLPLDFGDVGGAGDRELLRLRC